MPFIQWIGPTPLKPEKQPQIIAPFPPLCLSVPLVYLGSKCLPLGLHTFKLPSGSFKFYFDSSPHNTLFQSLMVQFGNSILAFLFFGEVKGFFAALKLRSPESCNRMQTIFSDTESSSCRIVSLVLSKGFFLA